MPRLPFVAVAATLCLLYGLTLCPSVYWYDSAEFAAHAASLGVPHPPGYPLYTLLAHTFTYLPVEPALGVNLMSLVFGVGSCLLLLWLTAYALAAAQRPRLVGGIVAALTLGTAPTFWANSVVTEVYTPGLFFTLLTLALLLQAERQRRPLWLVLAGLTGGLGVGVHMSIATFGLGYAWLVLSHPLPGTAWVSTVRAKLAVKSALAAAAGLLVFAYIPLRTFTTGSRREWVIFLKNFTGGTFKRRFLREYDLRERALLVGNILVDNLQIVGLILCVLGLLFLLKKRPRSGIALLLGAAGNLYWFFNYRVPDLDVFFLPAIAAMCICVGIAADELGDLLGRRHKYAPAIGLLALALPLASINRNYGRVDLSQATQAAAYGESVCETTEQNGIIAHYSSPKEWRFYSVLLYQQEALHRRPDIELWRKPKPNELIAKVKSGAPVYMFDDPPRRLRFRLEGIPEGRLMRLRLRSLPPGNAPLRVPATIPPTR
ncbi:MAG TPA: DUF2723 domain-containing protein [Nannocystis exedens]|nr:DUF2723 domain-containing protein [Nannocystis exedens]